MTTRELPKFLKDMLSACPSAGTGVHNWLFRCARQLHAHYTDPGEIVRLLEAVSHGCGRPIPMREITAAVHDSGKVAWQPGNSNAVPLKPEPAWPVLNKSCRAAVLRDGFALVDLWESSPVRIDWSDSKTEEIIDTLFPGNPLLCCGKSSSEFATRTREKWRGRLEALPLIVPSPMTAKSGLTKDGHQSEHCLGNTGPRRFLVIEFDQGTFDEHAALLWHLKEFGPLTLTVHSGSKSLHGWFAVNGRDENKLCAFMRYAVGLGADHATWTRSQFCRMPDGTREKSGVRQAVYYFNPDSIKQP
jgi:hypothetical protein